MKAALIRDYGGPEAIVYDDAPDPVPASDALLVMVEAVGVNPANTKFHRGDYKVVFPRNLPLIRGMDVVGRVLAMGNGVTGFAPGQRVLAMIPHTHTGGYAEQVAAPAIWFSPIPEGLDATTAAALPTPGLTGMQLVEDHLAITQGMRIIVTGATGAVGLMACMRHIDAARMSSRACGPGIAVRSGLPTRSWSWTRCNRCRICRWMPLPIP